MVYDYDTVKFAFSKLFLFVLYIKNIHIVNIILIIIKKECNCVVYIDPVIFIYVIVVFSLRKLKVPHSLFFLLFEQIFDRYAKKLNVFLMVELF